MPAAARRGIRWDLAAGFVAWARRSGRAAGRISRSSLGSPARPCFN